MKKILFVLGSLRERSFNKQVAQHVENLLEGKAQVEWLDYADLPWINQDTEFPAPSSVTRVRQAVEAADALWLFTPEYNYSYPGQVKNLLDWLSRPLRADDLERHTSVEGKTVALTGIGGSNCTKACLEKLTQLLSFMNTHVLEQQVGLMVNMEAWSDDKVVLTSEQQQELKAQTEALLAAIA